MLKQKIDCEYSTLNSDQWKRLPEGPGSGGGRWQPLHVSPESGSWTAAFLYPKGASVPSHVHVGPGEYFMVRGKLEVRGGASDGGVTATAPCYGYEATGALHDQTIFLEETEVYMRFQGPLQFVDAEGQTVGIIGWKQVQAAWDASLA